MQNKLKHLDIIQGVVNRMARNSFSLKGWAVTLVSGIFALSSKDSDKAYFLITYVPILVFWGMDSYYLLQERLFRSLYNSVRNQEESSINFSMDISIPEYRTAKNRYLACLLSGTELWFYLPLAVLSTGIIIITNI